MKERIYKWLDEHYPIDVSQDNLIDVSYDRNVEAIVDKVFGVTDITFKDWKTSRVGNEYGINFGDGNYAWYKNGKLHRGNNLPAVIYLDNSKYWYENGTRSIPTN